MQINYPRSYRFSCDCITSECGGIDKLVIYQNAPTDFCYFGFGVYCPRCTTKITEFLESLTKDGEIKNEN